MTPAEQNVAIDDMAPASLGTARRGLGGVEFADRLTAYRMNVAAGSLQTDLYSLDAVVRYLSGTDWDRAVFADNRSQINWIDTDRLVAWLRDAIGDTALADAVRDAVSGDMGFHDQILTVTPILTRRCDEYQRLIDADDTEGDSSETPVEQVLENRGAE